MTHPVLLLAAPLLVAVLVAPLRAQDPPFHESVLENGIRVTVVEAPDAKTQCFLTLMPYGLLSDGVGETQLCHLFEHFMLRSSEPENPAYEVDGFIVNGETTAGAMRLETIAPLDRWRDAQQHHAEWLRAGALQPDEALDAMLVREKGIIRQEVETTSMAGATHKWALAAWNQVVRHGATDVAALGDVENASTEQVVAGLARRLRFGSEVHVVAIGPVDVDEVLAAIAVDFGGFKALPPSAAPAATARERLRSPVDLDATWDIPVRHYMEWYAVLDRGPADRMMADALALLVNTRIQQRQTLASMGVQAAAFADLVVPEGRFLLISAPLPAGTDLATVRGELRELYDSFGPKEVELLVQSMGEQLVTWIDGAAIRADPQYADYLEQLELLEAQQTLFLLYAQANMGLGLQGLKAYASLEAQDVLDFGATVLAAERRSSLRLSPRDG